jgi:hypothetical protein
MLQIVKIIINQPHPRMFYERALGAGAIQLNYGWRQMSK